MENSSGRGGRVRRAVSVGYPYLILATACLFMVLPLAWAAVSSLKDLNGVYAFPPTFTLRDPQWTNFADAATRLPLIRFLLNSLVISAAGVSGAILTASMTGFALARLDFRGRTWCFRLVIFAMLVPAPVLWIPRFLLFDALSWVDTYKPLIVPAWLGGGAFNIFLFRQFFLAMPRDWEDASTLDGATPWQTYWHVFLPLAKPATVTAVLLSFVFHWQEFLDPLLYLSDFNSFPVSLGLRMYQSLAGTWANLLMAASLIALVPVVAVFVLCQRHLMRALNPSADAGNGD